MAQVIKRENNEWKVDKCPYCEILLKQGVSFECECGRLHLTDEDYFKQHETKLIQKDK